MKQIKVLGSGCRNCVNTADLIEKKAADLGIDIALTKVTDIADIVAMGVMSTPGVAIDDKVVHAGGVPTPDQIETWLKSGG